MNSYFTAFLLFCKGEETSNCNFVPGIFFPVGEDKLSYGYDSSGKKAIDSEFAEYGQTFGAEDVIGCYLVS